MPEYLCIYADATLSRAGHLIEPKLAMFTERHKIRVHPPTLHDTKDPLREMMKSEAQGILVELSRGWPDFAYLRLARRVLQRRRKFWVHWPNEDAVECIDEERLQSYYLHRAVIAAYQCLLAPFTRLLPARWRASRVSAVTGLLDSRSFETIETNDRYKDEIQTHWNENPCGSHYAKESAPHTLEWFREVQTYRYKQYAPWMPETMEFSRHSGEKVLEIGGGLGTDLCQFAFNGAEVTDLDLSAGHLALARENFELRGLKGRFIHHDAEDLPFEENVFDVVYSNGVLHHTPNTAWMVQEMWRVLKPGGKAIAMVYAQNSWHYWVLLVFRIGLLNGMLQKYSMGEITSQNVEMTETGSKPLVKVYTKRRLRNLFERFSDIEIVKTQLTASEFPPFLRWIPLGLASRFIGWNLVIKATKPRIGHTRG